LRATIAQRLVRTLCDRCKVRKKLKADDIADDPRFSVLGFHAGDTIFEPHGCDRCGDTGYRGRSGIFEIIEMTGSVRDLITEHTDSEVIQRAAVKAGMASMIDDAIAKCRMVGHRPRVLRVTTVRSLTCQISGTAPGRKAAGGKRIDYWAPTAAEVANRIEFLGLVPIETVTEAGGNYKERLKFSLLSRRRAEDVTVFTRDLRSAEGGGAH
jgi:hypothetical protein